MVTAAELCGFERDRRTLWCYHLLDWNDELLAIVARAVEAGSTFIEILGAMREGQNDSAPRNPPDPAADGLPGAHPQAGEILDDRPEHVDEALHGRTPPIRGGMPGLENMGLWGEVPQGATGQPGRDLGTHPHPGGGT